MLQISESKNSTVSKLIMMVIKVIMIYINKHKQSKHGNNNLEIAEKIQ